MSNEVRVGTQNFRVVIEIGLLATVCTLIAMLTTVSQFHLSSCPEAVKTALFFTVMYGAQTVMIIYMRVRVDFLES